MRVSGGIGVWMGGSTDRRQAGRVEDGGRQERVCAQERTRVMGEEMSETGGEPT